MKRPIREVSEKITLSPAETTKITGFGITKTYAMLQSGEMPSIRVGKKFFVPRAALVRWIESCGQKAVA